MSKVNDYYASHYDWLVTFYPRFYREVFEMDAILRAEGALVDDVADGAEKMLANNFIDTMDEDTLSKLEAFLNIAMMRERTPDERRRFIKSFIAGMGKVSATRITEMIRAYTNTAAVCDFYPYDDERNNRLDIEFERGDEPVIYISDIYTLLAKMLPAHIDYRAILTYSFRAGIRCSRTHYKYSYDLCGTKPYSVLIGDIENVASAVKTKIDRAIMDYKRSSADGEYSGGYPMTALLARLKDARVAVKNDTKGAVSDYRISGSDDEAAGLYPLLAMLADADGADAAITAEIKAAINDYIASGVKPETALLAHKDVINSAAAVSATDCGVNYIPCGTNFSGNGG